MLGGDSITRVLRWLDQNPQATLCLGRCEFEGQPSWVCLIRGREDEAIEYMPDPRGAVAKALGTIERNKTT